MKKKRKCISYKPHTHREHSIISKTLQRLEWEAVLFGKPSFGGGLYLSIQHVYGLICYDINTYFCNISTYISFIFRLLRGKISQTYIDYMNT